MQWFKHDADANADAKLQNVLLDYGLEGYGLYWYCIEMIAGKVCVENLNFELEHDARIIARNTGSTPQKVEEMMKYFVKVGLFECSEGVITCLKMAKRLDKSMTSNPKMRSMISKMRESGSHDSVMMIPDAVMQEQNRTEQNREDKKIKNKAVEFLPPEGLNQDAWSKWVDFRRASKFKAYQNNAQSAGRAMQNLINLSGGDFSDQLKIVEQSMNNNWQGLFPLKHSSAGKPLNANLNSQKFESGSF